MTCQTQTVYTHQTHVMPMNAGSHWREYVDRIDTCGRQATVHVWVEYHDGTVVERDMCLACCQLWQREVELVERRNDIPALGIIHPKARWVITEKGEEAQA